jgi:AraC-like DNA-binding protein
MVLQITLKVMSKTWLMDNWSLLYSYSSYLPLFYGPLVYLFVKYRHSPRPFKAVELLHFLPAAVIIICITLDNFTPVPEAVGFIIFHPVSRLLILLPGLLLYHALAFKIIPTGDTTSIHFNWIKQFILISTFVTLTVAFASFVLYMNYPAGHEYRYAFLLLSFFIYWLSYTALNQPEVFDIAKGSVYHQMPPPQLSIYKQNAKYANSTLTDEEAEAIAARLKEIIHRDKPYLQTNYSINQLADSIHCSRHHLSQVLNEKMQHSFNDYVNNLRMDEARRLLQEPGYSNYKIASIAYDAGFNSLSTFNDVFKKHTGKTPSEYRKELLKEEQKLRV